MWQVVNKTRVRPVAVGVVESRETNWLPERLCVIARLEHGYLANNLTRKRVHRPRRVVGDTYVHDKNRIRPFVFRPDEFSRSALHYNFRHTVLRKIHLAHNVPLVAKLCFDTV